MFMRKKAWYVSAVVVAAILLAIVAYTFVTGSLKSLLNDSTEPAWSSLVPQVSPSITNTVSPTTEGQLLFGTTPVDCQLVYRECVGPWTEQNADFCQQAIKGPCSGFVGR
jgi:hypothetical protein